MLTNHKPAESLPPEWAAAAATDYCVRRLAEIEAELAAKALTNNNVPQGWAAAVAIDYCVRRLAEIEAELAAKAAENGKPPKKKSGALSRLAAELGLAKSYLHAALNGGASGRKTKIVQQVIERVHGGDGDAFRTLVVKRFAPASEPETEQALNRLAAELGLAKSYLHAALNGGATARIERAIINVLHGGNADAYRAIELKRYAQLRRLLAAGVPVRLDTLPGYFDAAREIRRRSQLATNELMARLAIWSVTDFPIPLDTAYLNTLVIAANHAVHP